MNCLCNLLDNDIVWVILIALLLANICNNGDVAGARDCYRG